MKRVIPVIVVFLVLAILAAAGWWWATQNPTEAAAVLNELGLGDLAPAVTQGLTASGIIEAEEVSITALVGGRVQGIVADEGDEVQKDQVLVRLDDSLIAAQIKQGEAAVGSAQAALAQVQAGARPAQIRQAEATLAQAKAMRDGAKRAWENAVAVRNNPQELDLQINEATTQLEMAGHRVKQAQGNRDAVKAQLDLYKRLADDIGTPDIKAQYLAYSGQHWAAEEAILEAEAARKGAEAGLKLLQSMKANPLTMNAQVDAAKTQYEVAEAQVKQAEAALELLKAGATKEEVDVAKAQVAQAQAALNSLKVQRDQMLLTSPIDGLVTSREVYVGEMATPGLPLLTVANLDTVKLTVYIPENAYGKVKVGQEVAVTVDSFPGETFEGTVVYIANRAEFTPKNVQTKEERVSTVYAIKIRVPNPDHKLKPGMPADAIIMAR
jgi:multidrug resistance efflux pump